MRDGLGQAQTVLVLGGTSEIGVATADALVPAHGTIILAGRDPTALDHAAARLARPDRRVETARYEATGPAATTVDMLADVCAQAGDLDAVVLCVGVLTDEALIGGDTVAAESSLQANMLGPMLAVHAAAHRLREQGHGTLVVLSSTAAVRARAGLLTYGVAKTALDIYARRVGASLRGSGNVWDMSFDGDPSIVEVYISYLRKKVDQPFGRASIETIRGAGYRLAEDG